ncbi:hypothetical protein NEOLEDRAFT_1154103 [Neolentinus lepideus HHB14362 ss-1]|uniref:Uncharacterized protein n=1 Tax=Neolentinus lepideus HHB14362 ss-1 TaxID=1314782 RepID=A0A165V208_9AGAM|nr:hypothetical protein NEOLEDRAFT_1154103 [Neolentinus lepideus HHB14362 ss-1]
MASNRGPAQPAIAESKSRDLIPVGPKHVQGKYQGSKRTEEGAKPTTARALVLRNGKYGAIGTGEVVLANKISGREKLDLLGDDLLEQRVEMEKKALGPPFRLEKCLRIAHAQFNAALDEVKNLQDSESFFSEIVAEIVARTPPDKYKKPATPLQDSRYVTSIVATRIHNAYTAASAWKLVRDTLHELDEEGLIDATARNQIRRDEHLRSLYLVLYDLVNELIQIYQSKFSVYIMVAPHYAKYFKPVPDSDPGDPEIMFDWVELKAVHRSFLDSIIIELCLPQSRYPKQVLYSILHDAVDESPREAKRFSQAVWDTVGDLAMAVELQDMIESPLLGADSTQLKNSSRQMPEEYEDWIDAQLFSDKAAKDLSIRNHVFPLEKTRTKSGLEALWKTINANYKAISGQDIDDLWNLAGEKKRTPRWHAYYMPSLREDDEGPGTVSRVRAGKGGKKPLALTAGLGAGDESDSSMPSLQSVSDSEDEESEDEDEYEDESDEYDNDYETESEEDGYDTDEEEQARELLREAMDYAMRDPEFLNVKSPEAELNLDEDVKGNPFLKLLGSLRGRLFSADPNLKTKVRAQPRKPFFGGKKPPAAEDFEDDDEVPPLEPIAPSARKAAQPEPSKGHGVTVEEVEDEEVTSAKKKKKKPKKKKKKPSTTAPAEQGLESPVPTVSPPPEPMPTTPSPVTSSELTSPPQTPLKRKNRKGSSGASTDGPKSPPTPSTTNTSSTYLPSMSTASLVTEQKAQSVRSYLQSEGLDTTKMKVKSRGHASDMAPIKAKKKGLFSGKFGRKEKAEGEDDEESIKKSSKDSYFSRLSKKSTDLMHQLLRTKDDQKMGRAPMKWEQFLKVMREMGFSYDPSTAGSSVRFDPPNPRDPPITFHKPHPDPTIQPIRLREYAKDLEQMYGWTEEEFYKAL